MNEKIKQSCLEMFTLCMELKSKGHDAFLYYSPHVNWLRITIDINGWVDDKESDMIFDYIETSIDNDDDFDIVMEKHNEVKNKLKELLEV